MPPEAFASRPQAGEQHNAAYKMGVDGIDGVLAVLFVAFGSTIEERALPLPPSRTRQPEPDRFQAIQHGVADGLQQRVDLLRPIAAPGAPGHVWLPTESLDEPAPLSP